MIGSVRLTARAATLGVVALCLSSMGASAGQAGSPAPHRPSSKGVSAAASAPRQAAGHAGHDHGTAAHRHDHDKGSSPQALAERRRLLDVGEASLLAGDIDSARRAFEQAANMAHSAEIELGVLRTQMQAGEYRHALAFAAHTAGVHLDDVEGAVFYAWLLNLGAQMAVAERALGQAEAHVPGHPLVQQARERLQAGAMLATGALSQPPVRLSPYATGAVASPQARVVASALLLADGRHALVPRTALPPSGSIWLRNGLGHTVAASLTLPDGGEPVAAGAPDTLGLALLSLAQPLPVAGGEMVPPRDAFAGSPAFALDYPLDAQGQPAWPVMRPGFMGSALPMATPARQLGVSLPGQGPRGGPVYDQGGRLVGLAWGAAWRQGTAMGVAAGPAQARAPGTDRLIPVGALRKAFGERFGQVSTEARASPVGADELYERAMKTTLQVLVSGAP